MLKASLHLHTSSDPHDSIKYTNYEAIDRAAELKFDVISITCHNKVVFSHELREYGARKNILLIPGIEKSIEWRHILILNADKDAEKINTFQQLREIKPRKNWLIMVAHPFFPPMSLWTKDTIAQIDLFDAIEHCYFYSRLINFNKKAHRIAAQFNKPLIGTSDIHILKYFEPTYSVIEAEKNIESIFSAIRANKINILSKPFPTHQLPLIFGKMLSRNIYGKMVKGLLEKPQISTNIT